MTKRRSHHNGKLSQAASGPQQNLNDLDSIKVCTNVRTSPRSIRAPGTPTLARWPLTLLIGQDEQRAHPRSSRTLCVTPTNTFHVPTAMAPFQTRKHSFNIRKTVSHRNAKKVPPSSARWGKGRQPGSPTPQTRIQTTKFSRLHNRCLRYPNRLQQQHHLETKHHTKTHHRYRHRSTSTKPPQTMWRKLTRTKVMCSKTMQTQQNGSHNLFFQHMTSAKEFLQSPTTTSMEKRSFRKWRKCTTQQ